MGDMCIMRASGEKRVEVASISLFKMDEGNRRPQ